MSLNMYPCYDKYKKGLWKWKLYVTLYCLQKYFSLSRNSNHFNVKHLKKKQFVALIYQSCILF